MENDNPLLSLPSAIEVKKEGVTNATLIPSAHRQPVAAAMPAAGPSLTPESLGSGSKIPDSHNSRMMSQFATPPDYESRRRETSAPRQESGSWWTDSSRLSMVGNTPYRTDYGAGSKETAPQGESAIKAKIAQEKAVAKQQKNLMQQKDFLLSTYCTNGNAKPGSAEAYRVMGQVSEINRQLGLPAGHFGNWKIPT